MLSLPASGQRPRRQRRLTDRERDGSSRSESFWARMHPQTQSDGTTEDGPRFWSTVDAHGPRGLAGGHRAAQENAGAARRHFERDQTRLRSRCSFVSRSSHATGHFCSTAWCNNWPRANSLRCARIRFRAEVCAWSGAADGIVVEFDAWLNKRYPRPSRTMADQPCCENLRSRCERFNTHQVSRSIAVSAFGQEQRLARLARSMLSASSSG
jgi:hypothetical protein